MRPALRLLFVHGPGVACWRAGFDLVQAAAALDLPVELAFAADGLDLILATGSEPEARAARGAYASLELLGIDMVRAQAIARGDRAPTSALPVQWLQPSAWRDWLRCAPLQVW